MSIVLEKTNQINELMASLIYQIAQEQPHQDLYRQAVEVMLQVSELEKVVQNGGYKRQKKGEIEDQLQTLEIRKVGRKLLRWADHREQVNARLLIHFLELKRQGVDPITKSRMEQFADREGIKNFNSNFFGMSHVGEKNHGKVFEVVDGIVTIWHPVVDAVTQFEETVTTQESEKELHQAVLDSVVQQQNELQSKVPEPQLSEPKRGELVPFEEIYPQFKALWLKKTDQESALDLLEQAGIERGLAADHLSVLESMMRGEQYQNLISAEATHYFIEQVRADFSRGYLGRVLQAIEQHLDYQQEIGNPQPEIRAILDAL